MTMSHMEMGDLEIIIHAPDGKDHKVDTPANITIDELIKELLASPKFPEKEGNWTLFHKITGVYLDPEKTLEQSGVKSGHTLFLELRPKIVLIKVKVLFSDGTGVFEEVSPGEGTQQFIDGVVAKSGKSNETGTRWSLDDKDTGRGLAPEKTLAENGVLDGHHLFLKKSLLVVPWWRKPVVVAAALAMLTGMFGIVWNVTMHRRPVVSVVTVVVSPNTIDISPGEQRELTATISGSPNHDIEWSISPEIGSISQNGLYSAPATLPKEASVIATARSRADRRKFATATITFSPPTVVVRVTPPSVGLGVRETSTFTAEVTGSADTRVDWSVDPPVGSISDQGVYASPAAIASEQTITIKAKSHAAPEKLGMAKVELHPVTLKLLPVSATVKPSDTVRFSIAVGGTPNTAVTWSVNGPGTITNSTYQAPAALGAQQTVTVTATSRADTTKSATATVTIRPDILVTLNPATATLGGAQQQTFSASVTGTINKAVTWSISGPGSILNGVYTAPNAVPGAQPVTVMATSVADTMKAATAQINLIPVSIKVGPSGVTLSAGKEQRFSATVTGTSNLAVMWTLSGVGSISRDGLYTAPPVIRPGQTARVTATSAADASKSDVASISLTPTPTKNPRVCFYENINYQGWEQCMFPGDEVDTLGPHNKETTSIRFWDGAQIIVYDKKSFAGRSQQFTQDIPDLRKVPGKWNDEIQSTKIGPMPPDRICVFENPNYTGRSRCWAGMRDIPNLGADGDWSDKISSIQVWGHGRAIFYRDINYMGDRLPVTGNIPDLRSLQLNTKDPHLTNLSWNHQISSLQVR
jgi:hypothetical protein